MVLCGRRERVAQRTADAHHASSRIEPRKKGVLCGITYVMVRSEAVPCMQQTHGHMYSTCHMICDTQSKVIEFLFLA